MDSKIIFFSITLLFSSAAAIDITTLLDQYPSFSTFNSYLTQTQIADIINSRQPPVTVLVVDNSNISPLSGKSPDVLKKIMSAHVILDYFDVPKLQNLQDKSVLATTLFQTTGQAVDNQGYLNITDVSTGNVAFGSAAKGATLGSNLVKSVETQPYDLSVVEISNVIVPLGIDNPTNTDSSSGNSTSATSPSSSPVAPVPSSSPTNAPTASPTKPPAASPTNTPTASPTNATIASPIKPPAASPTNAPTASPTKPPVASPTNTPIASPTKPPAASPTNTSAASPTKPPSASPTNTPTASPITPPAPSPRKMLSPAKSPSPAPSKINAPTAAPDSAPVSIAGTPAPTADAPTKDKDSSVGTALGVSAGIIAAIVSSNLFLVLMA